MRGRYIVQNHLRNRQLRVRILEWQPLCFRDPATQQWVGSICDLWSQIAIRAGFTLVEAREAGRALARSPKPPLQDQASRWEASWGAAFQLGLGRRLA